MNHDLFERHPASRQRHAAYVASVLVVLLAASAAWHALRPEVLRQLAIRSIGCPARSELIAAAARTSCRELPPRQDPGLLNLWSLRTPHGALVMWQAEYKLDHVGKSPLPARAAPYVFADDRLAYRGQLVSVMVPQPTNMPDADGDGRPEICVVNDDPRGSASPAQSYWALVRLCADGNEVTGLVAGPGWLFVLQPECSTTNGTRRLALMGPAVSPSGRETVATFEWTAPAGILRPTMLPADGSLLAWTPADGKPYRFSPDECVDDVVRRLLNSAAGSGALTTAPTREAPTNEPSPTQPTQPP